MYVVYRCFRDDEVDYTEVIGIFPSESDAQVYVVFYALSHLLSSDDFCIGFDSDLKKIIE